MSRQVRIKDKIVREKIAKTLKEHREELEKNIPEMAKILCMSSKTLENIENKASISVTNLLKILAHFHYDPHLFLDEK